MLLRTPGQSGLSFSTYELSLLFYPSRYHSFLGAATAAKNSQNISSAIFFYEKLVDLCEGKYEGGGGGEEQKKKKGKEMDKRKAKRVVQGTMLDKCASREGLKEALDFIEKYTNHPTEEEYIAFPIFVTSLVGVGIFVIVLSILVYCCTGRDTQKTKQTPIVSNYVDDEDEFDDEEKEYRKSLKDAALH